MPPRRLPILLAAACAAAALAQPAAATTDVVTRFAFFPGGAGQVGCDPGERVIGGGAGVQDPAAAYLARSEPRPLITAAPLTAWDLVLARRNDGAAAPGSVYALCSRAPADVVLRSAFLPAGAGEVSCAAGETPIGGGAGVDDPGAAYIARSEPRPFTNGSPVAAWHADVRNRGSGAPATGSVYVICSRSAVDVVSRTVFLPAGEGDAACEPGEAAIGGGAGVVDPAAAYLARSEPRPLTAGVPLSAWNTVLRLRSTGAAAPGSVYVLCSRPVAPPPPQQPQPQPTPEPQPQDPPPLRSADGLGVQHRWAAGRRSTVMRRLVVTVLPPGATLTVRCAGRGCPFGRRVLTFPAGKRNHRLTPLFAERRLRPGARITVAIAAPGWIGKQVTFTVRRGSLPRVTVRCVPPGERPRRRC